jgi:DNA-binding transcriptional MerR regulator
MVSQKKKANQTPTSKLQEIPDKLYFPIGEVAVLCDLKPHVLRYWEQEFSVLKPVKRRGNRRYYQKKDVEVVREIRDLLYIRGFTIEGARQHIASGARKEKPENAIVDTNTVVVSDEKVKSAVSELESLLGTLEEG